MTEPRALEEDFSNGVRECACCGDPRIEYEDETFADLCAKCVDEDHGCAPLPPEFSEHSCHEMTISKKEHTQ